MKAARIVRFGSASAITFDDIARPEPGIGQLRIRVAAAGVGNWDALIRTGKVQLQPLPIVLGSELSGVVDSLGPEVSAFHVGDEVYGATNQQFSGAYAEYSLASASMIAAKPKSLNFVEAASVPIGAVTAWQRLFEYAQVTAGQTVLIHGAAGNVGAYAVQMARRKGVHIIATAGSSDLEYVRDLGAERVLDYKREPFDELLDDVDVVLDTIGGDTQQRSLRVLKPGGILVSSVSAVSSATQTAFGVRAAYFYVEVTTPRLDRISELFDVGDLKTNIGTVLPLEAARAAHELLEGVPHKRGKIVLRVST